MDWRSAPDAKKTVADGSDAGPMQAGTTHAIPQHTPRLSLVKRLLFRLAQALGLVLGVVTLTFILINLAPGDPARLWVGPAAGAEELEGARHALGLDRSLWVRYFTWMIGFVTGQWGTSIAQQRPVTEVLSGAVPHTLLLTVTSLLLTYIIGIAVGSIQAINNRTRLDTGLTVFNLLVYGMPAYWLAIMLVLVFSYHAPLHGWPEWLRLPAMGVSSLNADFLGPWHAFVDRLRHAALPLITLTAIGAAGTSRFVRNSLLDVRRLDFVLTARAKGMRTLGIEIKHVLRNGLLPIVTLLGLSLPALFSGTVFVEVIFAWPGMGREMVAAVLARDYPVIMATTAIYAALVVAGNMLADFLYGVADPRTRNSAS
ncbi:MAG: ABC transporter permease [Gemmatimonadales bacterium]